MAPLTAEHIRYRPTEMPSVKKIRRNQISACIILLALSAPAIATVDRATDPPFIGNAATDADRWQRIDLQSKVPLRNASQITITIQTRRPSMQGMIRIPGGIASNFDTGSGKTVVDLINVRDKTEGFTDVGALEVIFTRAASGQLFWVLTVDYVDGTK